MKMAFYDTYNDMRLSGFMDFSQNKDGDLMVVIEDEYGNEVSILCDVFYTMCRYFMHESYEMSVQDLGVYPVGQVKNDR